MKRRESPWVKAVVASIVRPIMTAATKATWEGQHHIPREGGVILAANHLSLVDPLTIAHYLYVAGHRWPTFTAKEGVFRIPVVGAVARSTGQIPVFRGSTDAIKALREAAKALTVDNASVIFYPEGTCTRDPDMWPMVAKTGVARLALETGVPVVPLAHWGEQDLLPYGTAKVRPFPRKNVHLLAGPPVDLTRFAGQHPTPVVLKDATAAIMRDIAGLQGRIRGEKPPAALYDMKKAREQQLIEDAADPDQPPAANPPGAGARADSDEAAE